MFLCMNRLQPEGEFRLSVKKTQYVALDEKGNLNG